MHPELRDEIKKIAIDEKKSVADIIEKLLEKYLVDKMKKSINGN